MPAPVDELLSRRLADLPSADGGPDGWTKVQARLRAREQSLQRVQRFARGSMAAALAVLAAIVALSIHASLQRPGADATVAQQADATSSPASASEIERLRAQSVALEQVLAALPERPAVARAATSLPIDTLETQVQWLDHRLSAGADPGSPEDAEQLWRERVEAMNSLVRLRYAEAQQVAM